MNVEKRTKLEPVTLGYVLDPSRPVLPYSKDIRKALCHAEHSHPRGQLIYAGKGVMRVVCGGCIRVVPPTQAVWAPPWAPHIVEFPGDVSLRNVFVDPSRAEGLPETCAVLEVGPLLREMIFKLAELGCDYSKGSRTWRLALAFLDELKCAEPSRLELPVGSDPRLTRLIERLLESPADDRTLALWAKGSGASARTLARLFEKETGMSFGAWRRRLKLMCALERLEGGESVSETACALGYSSFSAFVAMFRKEQGVTPGKLRSKRP